MDYSYHLVGYGRLVLFGQLLGDGNVKEGWCESLACDSSKSAHASGAHDNQTLVRRDSGSCKYFPGVVTCWHPPGIHIGLVEHRIICMLMICSSVLYRLMPIAYASITCCRGKGRGWLGCVCIGSGEHRMIIMVCSSVV